jgi:hypothetical protein
MTSAFETPECRQSPPSAPLGRGRPACATDESLGLSTRDVRGFRVPAAVEAQAAENDHEGQGHPGAERADEHDDAAAENERVH